MPETTAVIPPPRGELWPGTQPVPPLWSARVWPVAATSAPTSVLVGAVLAGLLGSVALSGPLGVGVGLLACAVLLTALATRPRPARPVTPSAPAAPATPVASTARARTATPRQIGFALLSVALFGVSAVRTAPWLVALCLLAGTLTAVFAVTAGRSWSALALGALSPLGAFSRAARWAGRGAVPVVRDRSVPVGRVLLTALVSAVLLLVFGGLFAGADPVFADLLTGLVPQIDAAEATAHSVLFVLVAAGTLVAACLAHQRPDFDAVTPARGPGRSRLEWAIPVGALTALFACFVGVQLVVLADGNGHVLRTAGLTYAEYARQGFWQLLAVTALTLLVVAVVVRIARRETRADRTALRVLLGVLCLLAVLVVASAVRRMWLYEDAYGFTRLRVLVQAVEFWLGTVFVLIALAGVRLRGRWLPRTVIASGALTLLALAAVNPDAFVAERNVARAAETGRIDVGYLSGLSPDATPVLARLPEPQRACALRFTRYDLAGDEAWYTRNLARERARALLDERPATGC